jgi:hypothetical protein
LQRAPSPVRAKPVDVDAPTTTSTPSSNYVDMSAAKHSSDSSVIDDDDDDASTASDASDRTTPRTRTRSAFTLLCDGRDAADIAPLAASAAVPAQTTPGMRARARVSS